MHGRGSRPPPPRNRQKYDVTSPSTFLLPPRRPAFGRVRVGSRNRNLKQRRPGAERFYHGTYSAHRSGPLILFIPIVTWSPVARTISCISNVVRTAVVLRQNRDSRRDARAVSSDRRRRVFVVPSRRRGHLLLSRFPKPAGNSLSTCRSRETWSWAYALTAVPPAPMTRVWSHGQPQCVGSVFSREAAGIENAGRRDESGRRAMSPENVVADIHECNRQS